MDKIVAIAKRLLTTSAVYLYVIDSGCTGDAVDAENMRSIFNRDKSKVIILYAQ